MQRVRTRAGHSLFTMQAGNLGPTRPAAVPQLVSPLWPTKGSLRLLLINSVQEVFTRGGGFHLGCWPI